MLFQKRVMRITFDIYVLFVVFSLTRSVLEAAIYRTRGKQTKIRLYFFLSKSWLNCYFNEFGVFEYTWATIESLVFDIIERHIIVHTFVTDFEAISWRSVVVYICLILSFMGNQ